MGKSEREKCQEWKARWEDYKMKKVWNESFDGKIRKGNKDNEWKVWWEVQKGKQR